MSAVEVMEETQNHFVGEFESFERIVAASDPAWFAPIRKAAIADFAETGFPTTSHEEWLYTNVSNIAKTPYVRASAEHGAAKSVLSSSLAPALGGPRLVCVNGRYSESLSSLANVPNGLQVRSLQSALADRALPFLEARLAKHAHYKGNPFIALNTAFLEDGVVVHVGKGKVIETPVHIIHVAVGQADPVVTYPRTLVLAEENAQVTVVESFVSVSSSSPCLTVAAAELIAEPNAVIDHYRLGRESRDVSHVGALAVHLERSSRISSNSFSLDGKLVRNNVFAILNGEGADCILNGLYLLGDEQHVDNHLRVEHVAPHCHSWEYYKGILDDKSRGVFSGRIFVHKDAQKTDAKQTNKNLLLSDAARVDTKPQLEIFADDVKCTHGATIGQLDADALFYLRSRGLGLETARDLLTYAFASESLEQVKIEPLRENLQLALFQRMQETCHLEEGV